MTMNSIDTIERFRTIKPEIVISPNAALAELSKSVLNGFYEFKKDDAGYQVHETICILDDMRNKTRWQEYSEFDRIVHDCAVSHYNAGNHVFSLEILCKTVSGDRETISPEYKKAVLNSLFKLMRTIIEIRGEYKGKEIHYFGNLLHVEILATASINGFPVNEAISIIREPILYTYSQSRNHIISYPVKLLAVGGNTSTRTTSLNSFMLRRIEQIKNRRKISKYIKYDSIYQTTQAVTKIEKQRVRNILHKFLNNLVKQQYISEYQIIPKDRCRYHSVKILSSTEKVIP